MPTPNGSYEIYQDKSNYWRWRAKASNGRTVADSGESYYNRQDCLWGIQLMKNSGDWPVNDA